jgi:F-type H+-transporting ATPase subunit gamma
MESLEVLDKKIKTAGDLLSVVKTMKTMAAVNMRRFEQAADSMGGFGDVVELAWRMLFAGPMGKASAPASFQKTICLVIGSDQGMCGQFNEVIARETAELLKKEAGDIAIWSSGERVRASLDGFGIDSTKHFALPSGVEAISDRVYEVVAAAAHEHDVSGGLRFLVAANAPSGAARYEPEMTQAFPLSPERIAHILAAGRPNRCLPMHAAEEAVLYREIFRLHVFATLYAAFGRSMAAENGARLASMQSAEKNILELADDLSGRRNRTRQEQITSELLDVVVGFEAGVGADSIQKAMRPKGTKKPSKRPVRLS